MSVKVAPASKKKKTAPKASNTVAKKKDGSIDYGDDCKRASVWARIGVNSRMTRKNRFQKREEGSQWCIQKNVSQRG